MKRLVLTAALVSLWYLAGSVRAEAQGAACPGGRCPVVRLAAPVSLPVAEALHTRLAIVATRQPVRRALAGWIMDRPRFALVRRCR